MIKQLKNPFVWYAVRDWVEENMQYSGLGLAAMGGASINEEWPDDRNNKAEKTGQITVGLSQLFEKAVFEILKEAGVVKLKRKNDSQGDITINGVPFEIKTSQADKIQGATHSSQKPPCFIMIKYRLDNDKPLSLENNDGMFTEFGVWVSESIQPEWWHGKPTKKNSRTILNIPISSSQHINTIIGDINYSPKNGRKYCALINEVV